MWTKSWKFIRKWMRRAHAKVNNSMATAALISRDSRACAWTYYLYYFTVGVAWCAIRQIRNMSRKMLQNRRISTIKRTQTLMPPSIKMCWKQYSSFLQYYYKIVWGSKVDFLWPSVILLFILEFFKVETDAFPFTGIVKTLVRIHSDGVCTGGIAKFRVVFAALTPITFGPHKKRGPNVKEDQT